jgi:hypothetical protein
MGRGAGQAEGGEWLEHVVPRPKNNHAQFMLMSCLAPALAQVRPCCIVSRTAGGMARGAATAGCAFTSRTYTQSLLLPLLFLHAGRLHVCCSAL